MNAVTVATPPVVIVAVLVMGIRRTGILPPVRIRVLTPAVIRTACQRMTRRAVP